jgi:glycosyltransferase involved in cell wall biosynthesis
VTADTGVLMLGMGWFPDQPGGLNRYFRELYEALNASGTSASAVVVGPAAAPADKVFVPVAARDSLVRRLWGFARAAGAMSPVPVVDAHFALYAAGPVMFSPLRRTPLVVHFQGPWAQEGAVGGRDSRIATLAKRALERAVYRRARVLVVLSHAFKRILVEQYGIAPWRIQVIPPGVDQSRFSPGASVDSRRELGLPQDAWVVLTVRRLQNRMGIDVLLNAWSRLSTVSQPRRLLLIAGDGPNRQELEARSAALGVEDTVWFLGRISDAELAQAYRAADVCVVPSVELEGFGLVVLESLSSGTPVIGTNVGGLPETLRGLDHNLIVAPRDPQALASRLQNAQEGTEPLPSPELCRAYAQKFNWATVADRTRHVYDLAMRHSERRPVRVVYLDHCARLSGGELALVRLLPALRGVDPHVVLAEEGPLMERLVQAGISAEVLPLSGRARNLHRESVTPLRFPPYAGLLTANYVARLARRLRELRPDIVHTNSLKAAVYGGLAARLAGIPVVWHIRDRIASDYLPNSAARLIRWLGPRLSDGIIANSRGTLETLRLPRSSWVIPSPVVFDPVRLTPSNSPTSGRAKAFTVGMVGRIAPWKGQHVFIDAFARAFPKGSERAIIVGAALFGEDGYADEIHAMAVRLELDGRLEFAGFQDNVEAQLARFDVLVHASVIAEPFGQVVIEGMAAGLPVVAAATGGPAEIIDDNVNGLVYTPGDVDALARLLRLLSQDPQLRWRLGQAAKQRAQDFAPEVIAPQVLEVYRSLLANEPVADRLELFEKPGPGAHLNTEPEGNRRERIAGLVQVRK